MFLFQNLLSAVNYNSNTDPDGVGQGEGDSERQSFWNGDDEHRDADDEELEVLLEVLGAPRLVVDGERLDWEPQDEDEHSTDGHDHA